MIFGKPPPGVDIFKAEHYKLGVGLDASKYVFSWGKCTCKTCLLKCQLSLMEVWFHLFARSERSLARCNRQHLTRVSAKLVCVKNPRHRVLELLPSHCRFRTAGYKTKKLLVFFSCAIDLTANSTLAALVTLPREGVCLFCYEFSISRIIFFVIYCWCCDFVFQY